MKKLFSFLLACLLASAFPIHAKTPSLFAKLTPSKEMEAALDKAAEQAAKEASLEKATAEPAAAAAQLSQKKALLQTEQRVVAVGDTAEQLEKQGFVPAQEITWDAFEEHTDSIRTQYDDKQEHVAKGEQTFRRHVSAAQLVSLSQTPHAGLPDYGSLAHDKKYIYIAESSVHNTHTLPREGAKVLEEIRNANPNARILLALEMAILTKQTDSPLLAQQQTSDSSPIFIHPDYRALSDTAQRKNIDVLALDDYLLFDTKFANTYVAKVGSYAVRFDTSTSRVRRVGSIYGESFKKAPADVVYDFLSRSSWGVQQRNDQWVRYIQAIADFYDIIIVYAGNAHLLLNIYYSIPNAIGEDGLLLEMLTPEQLPQETQQLADKATEAQSKYEFSPEYTTVALTSYEKEIQEAKARQLKPFFKQLKKGKPFWIKYTIGRELDQQISSYLPKREQDKYKGQTSGALPGNFKWVAVYLPQAEKAN